MGEHNRCQCRGGQDISADEWKMPNRPSCCAQIMAADGVHVEAVVVDLEVYQHHRKRLEKAKYTLSEEGVDPGCRR